MKQIQFGHYGEPKDVVAVADQPLPEPRANQVRVRILLSPINPSDLLYLRGHYSGVTPAFPAPVGFEGVGVVDALGPGERNLGVGQRVLVRNSQGGNWADYAVVPSGQVHPVPEDIPDEQVASFLINPASAILLVRHVLGVPRGEWLLQSAADGELGRMIIRLAQRDGIRTLNVVRRKEAAAELEALGADAVIVSTEGPIDEQVRKIVGPQGVGYAIDPVAGQTGTEDLPVAVPGRPNARLRIALPRGDPRRRRPPLHAVGSAHPGGVLAWLLATTPGRQRLLPQRSPRDGAAHR
jgi:NADPH:quinone reductase-like Zn-dependent oxidoreductase